MGDGVKITGPFTAISYLTTADAQNYFDGRLNTDAWDDASTTDQNKSLLMATRAIDRLNFAGLRTSDYNARLTTLTETGILTNGGILAPSTSGQPLEFPRNGDTAIPQEIVIACCEVALALLDGVDPEIELQNLGTVHQGFAAVRETYDPNTARLAFRHGIASVVAWTFLYPFLADPSEVVLRRVN